MSLMIALISMFTAGILLAKAYIELKMVYSTRQGFVVLVVFVLYTDVCQSANSRATRLNVALVDDPSADG